AVYDNGGPLTPRNSAVSGSYTPGVRLEHSTATLAGDTFAGNGYAAVSMDLDSNPTITGETPASFSKNGTNGLLLDPGSLTRDLTWNSPDIVYVLSGSGVTVPTGRSLTLGAGQVVKASGFCFLTVDGTLTAQGTAAAPAVFTSIYDDADGGDTNNDGSASQPSSDWAGLVLNADSTANVLDHVQVLYAGAHGGSAAINDNGGPLTLSNSTIDHSGTVGVRLVHSTATLESDTFADTVSAAVSMDLDSNPTITGEAPASFSNNGTNGLLLDPGTLSRDLTWDNPDIVYVVNGSLDVPAGRKLTVGAGQVV